MFDKRHFSYFFVLYCNFWLLNYNHIKINHQSWILDHSAQNAPFREKKTFHRRGGSLCSSRRSQQIVEFECHTVEIYSHYFFSKISWNQRFYPWITLYDVFTNLFSSQSEYRIFPHCECAGRRSIGVFNIHWRHSFKK